MPKSLVCALVFVVAVVGSPAVADNVFGDREVVVAVLDTGVDPHHQEFDYGGPNDPDDQIVAWWDFSLGHTGPPEVWDTRVPEPFDLHGHGTAVASLAVGLNQAPAHVKEPSLAPGFKLAVGKIATNSGSVVGDVPGAIRWAVDVAKADVVNISAGLAFPVPALFSQVDEAIAYARQAGVLVVVSNGNGWANLGLPGQPGWASYFSPREALSVGAQGADGLRVTTDPEVTSRFSQVGVARAGVADGYTRMSGTSFSAPIVAGMAAGLTEEALANGRDASPEYVEQLLKWSARDLVLPPSHEGYGLLAADEFESARDHAAAGTLPPPPPLLNTFYVETVANGLRDVWNKDLDGGARLSVKPTGVASPSPSGSIGTSSPYGLSDAETFTISTGMGDTVIVDLDYAAPDPLFAGEHDIDLYVFAGAGPNFSWEDLVARSTRSAGNAEDLEFTASLGGVHTVVVVGWLVVRDQDYSIASSHPLEPAGDGFYVVHSSQGI